MAYSSSSSSSRKTLTSLIYISLIISSSSCLCSASSSSKVSLALYYESLCPYSANFIVNGLSKLIKNPELLSIVDIYLSPWGNAKFKSNDTFVCQHGPSECLLNTIEACAIHVWPQLVDHFPFINCIEYLVYKRRYPEWETCFDELNLDAKPISDCYASGLGKELELQYGAETSSLQPPHKYVPWVVVDGQPLYEDYENFVSYICKAYKTSDAPKACSELSLYNRQRDKANSLVPVSYKEKRMSTLSGQVISALSNWMQQMNAVVSA